MRRLLEYFGLMNSKFPFTLDGVNLPFPDFAGKELEVEVAIPVLQPRGDYWLFAKSGQLRSELQSILDERRSERWLYPSLLELGAAIACLTFFERVHAQDNGRWGSPKPIQDNNGHEIYLSFIHMFETDRAFLVRLDERKAFRVFYCSEPLSTKQYRVADLKMSMLEEDCGRSYSLEDGTVILEHVDRI